MCVVTISTSKLTKNVQLGFSFQVGQSAVDRVWDYIISYQGVVGRTVHKIQDGSVLIFLESRYMQQQVEGMVGILSHLLARIMEII
jgi:hypothetical protein